MYDVTDPSSSALIIDGLLCDVTVDGIRKWTAEVGEPCIGVEVGQVHPIPDSANP